MSILGFDRSHFNAEPNYATFKAGGGAYVLCKATEGTTYTDPTFAACRTHTEAAGLVFGSYHFARWGDPVAEARFYLSIASPQPGELVALDAEAAFPAGVDVVAWSLTFCQTVHAATGAWPFIYMNQAWLAGHNWAPLAANDGLWLARYDNAPTGGPTGPFPAVAMKQYTSTGTVPGEPGQVDVDAFNGTLDQLRAYAVPGGDISMADAQSILDFLQNTTGGDLRLINGKVDALAAAQVGYGRRIERIDEGNHAGTPDPWSYGTDIEAAIAALETKVDALGQQATPQVDPVALAQALAPLLLSDPKNVDALGAAIAAHLQLAPRADTPPPA